MKTVGAYYAKTHFSKLIDLVHKGEEIIITKHGVSVAVLQPFAAEKKTDAASVISKLRNFRDRNTLDGLSIREMIEEGRK